MRRRRGVPAPPHDEVGDIIVADVSPENVKLLLAPDRARLEDLIHQRYP
jgi:hypothetical protein